ncbi:GNAT family N-acetyltransferase [Ralstonia syzygii subsp. celebesensis]|uniref:N-acetyltransferase n=3 Tax=Ralstonia solanacearum species complex TaxID=3116862 RepID=A0AAD0S5A6_RALSL|nr:MULTISPECIES: GNAT family N-acetyltransferase [Ralstonia solanacearum species complex]CCA79698.1 putative acetyltransferase, GCN5-related N-acetyltransferase, putative spermidine/spermine acetyltransferase [blood disease bacterium R229]AQW29353.1 GNAT family N-acetyltransferase [blood disease bacterium A2-HR MARDI]AXV80759.1 N-acetyltransferase [Ralstonia solanacearum]AXW51907.1 N-acetyltransferase [Ralstonia solanacearum]QQV56774.1 GNAT family N-acetyltransferase [Ralstonia syzygii subsp. 
MTTAQADSAIFTLRPATPDDCEALVRLIGALAEYEKLTHLMQATPEALRTVLFGSRPYGEAVVAEVEGGAVGFALFFHNVSTFLCKPGLYLEDLFVEPAWRGHGIGKALLVHLARLARERDCGRFEWSVLDWNAPSIAFYEAMGADVLPDWRICRATGDALARMAALPMPEGLSAPA